MKSSTAPAGYHTTVKIQISLANDTIHTYAWDTPLGLSQAAHKCLGWAKEEMRLAKIHGRSHIHGYRIVVRYYPGEYANT